MASAVTNLEDAIHAVRDAPTPFLVLCGPQQVGKTSIACEAAKNLKLTLYRVNRADLEQPEIVSALIEMSYRYPSAILVEWAESVFSPEVETWRRDVAERLLERVSSLPASRRPVIIGETNLPLTTVAATFEPKPVATVWVDSPSRNVLAQLWKREASSRGITMTDENASSLAAESRHFVAADVRCRVKKAYGEGLLRRSRGRDPAVTVDHIRAGLKNYVPLLSPDYLSKYQCSV